MAIKDKIDPTKLSILYILLVHDYADFVTSIVDALDEPQHVFIIHVDTKAEHIQATLKHYYEYVDTPTTLPSDIDVDVGVEVDVELDGTSNSKPKSTGRGTGSGSGVNRNVYIMEEQREACNWGGFSIVNATLNAMRFAIDRGMQFDYCLDVSGTSYPIKSKEVGLVLSVYCILLSC